MFDLRVYYTNVPRLCTTGYSLLTHSRLLSPICVLITTTCPAYAHIATLAAVFCARHFVRVHVHRAWVLIAEFYLVDRGLRHRLPGFSSMGRLVILPFDC